MGAREGPGEASEGVGVAGADGGAAEGSDGIVGEEQEAEQAGREGFLGHPALAGDAAGVVSAVGFVQGQVQAIQNAQALVPAARDELGGGSLEGALPESSKPVGMVESAL